MLPAGWGDLPPGRLPNFFWGGHAIKNRPGEKQKIQRAKTLVKQLGWGLSVKGKAADGGSYLRIAPRGNSTSATYLGNSSAWGTPETILEAVRSKIYSIGGTIARTPAKPKPKPRSKLQGFLPEACKPKPERTPTERTPTERTPTERTPTERTTPGRNAEGKKQLVAQLPQAVALDESEQPEFEPETGKNTEKQLGGVAQKRKPREIVIYPTVIWDTETLRKKLFELFGDGGWDGVAARGPFFLIEGKKLIELACDLNTMSKCPIMVLLPFRNSPNPARASHDAAFGAGSVFSCLRSSVAEVVKESQKMPAHDRISEDFFRIILEVAKTYKRVYKRYLNEFAQSR